MHTQKIICPLCKSRVDTEELSIYCPICNTNLSASDERLLYCAKKCHFRIEDFMAEQGTLYLTNQRLFFMIEQSTGTIWDESIKTIYAVATGAQLNVALAFSFQLDEIESITEGKFSWFSKGICIETAEYAVHKIYVDQRKEWIERINQAMHAKK